MKLKPFQIEDLARAALHDGLILGQDTGLGKGLAAYVWPLLKVGLHPDCLHAPRSALRPAQPVLIVASGDLHEQIIEEGKKHFGVVPTKLDSQDTFLRLSTINSQPSTPRYLLPPGYYLSTYTQLSTNGIAPFPELDRKRPMSTLKALNLRMAEVHEFYAQRYQRYQRFYLRLGATPDDLLPALDRKWSRERAHANSFVQKDLDEAYHLIKHFAPHNLDNPPPAVDVPVTDEPPTARRFNPLAAPSIPRSSRRQEAPTSPQYFHLDTAQQRFVLLRFLDLAHAALSKAIGDTRRYCPAEDTAPDQCFAPFTIKCVYSPSLADLSQDAFAVVVTDEGTKLKGEDTLIGKGTRQMNPRYRLVMTATPIKNRLPDVFRLAHWATGAHHNACPRFPFSDSDRDTFAEEFSVSERNLSAEARASRSDAPRSSRRFTKLTPQVCNIHRLWKLFAPIILRRRKKDCGEVLVAKSREIIRVPLGKFQAEVYKFHLEAEYLDKNLRPAMGAKLQALRIAAANPASLLLQRPIGDATEGLIRSDHSYVPKLAACLSLIKQILDRREQFIVFSAFHDSLDALSAHLQEAGVKHLVLDGRTSQAKRGAAAKLFKAGPPSPFCLLPSPFPGLLAGVECMSEGHSFPLCNNVILLAYSWAYDKFEQAINRIHRLNSRWNVNVYPIIASGSIDRKLEAMIQEKGDAAELVLDGHLMGEDATEVNLAELLEIARTEFANQASTSGLLDERDLERDWPALRALLGKAMQAWLRPPITLEARPLLPPLAPVIVPEPELPPKVPHAYLLPPPPPAPKPAPKPDWRSAFKSWL